MNDIRNEEISSGDLLTEDSEDELADLQKEYEIRKQKLLEAKRLKKSTKSGEIRTKQVVEKPRSRSPSPEPIPAISKVTKLGFTPSIQRQQSNQRLPKQSQPASNFANNLYESTHKQLQKQTINYEDRLFGFDNLPSSRLHLDVDEKEPYSSYYINQRYINQSELNKQLQNVKVLRVEKLLAIITKPSYTEPSYVNWSFIGIILKKSDPLMTKITERNKVSKKYMKLTMGNFHHTVSIMLFGDSFNKYWKLQQGEVVVLLNPDVKRNPGGDGFTLSINHDLDSIIEIGMSRDFGKCDKMTSKNVPCLMIIDKSKQKWCNYHQDEFFNQGQRGGSRMALQGSVGLKEPTNAHGAKQSMYLSKNKNGSFGNSFISYDTVNQSNKIYEQETTGWRLDEEYSNPKILTTANRKRKLDELKSNKKLENKLMGLGLQKNLIKTLGLVKTKHNGTMGDKNETIDDELQRKKQAFNSSLLTKIGFDPTTVKKTTMRDDDSIYKSPTKKKRDLSKDLQELYEISNRKQNLRKLGSSRQDKLDKKQKWQENVSKLKNYKDDKLRYKTNDSDDTDFEYDEPDEYAIKISRQRLGKSFLGSPISEGKKKPIIFEEEEVDDNGDGKKFSLSEKLQKEIDRHDQDNDDYSDDELEIEFGDEINKLKYNKVIGNG